MNRGGPLRRTGLQRTTPLSPGAARLQRATEIARTEMNRRPTKRLLDSRAVLADVREPVLMRDGNSCIRCGVRATVLHHRRPRGHGGASRNADTHDPAVLLSLCDPCHEYIEHNRDEAKTNGWLILHDITDPTTVLTLYRGGWVTLDSDCNVIRASPPWELP